MMSCVPGSDVSPAAKTSLPATLHGTSASYTCIGPAQQCHHLVVGMQRLRASSLCPVLRRLAVLVQVLPRHQQFRLQHRTTSRLNSTFWG